MLFNLIVFIFMAAIAYFHYAQGLFTATLSAVLCIFAAVLAVGYHEMLVPFLINRLPDQADAVALIVCFVAAYAIPRLLIDRLVPGNVRFPLLMDKIGAGAMGLVAGLFATGLFAVAAQSMPFGPAIGGFSRQTLQDRGNIVLSSGGRGVDSSVSDELVGERLGDSSHQQGLWFNQDKLVLAMAGQVSDTGSALGNDHPLAAVHPDYLTELFGQRLAVPLGGKHLAINSDKESSVKATRAYALSKLPASLDAEVREVRGEQPIPEVPPPSGDTTLAVVRVTFMASPDLMDADLMLRTGPANIRLKAGTTDYYPVGTMVGAGLLLKNRADDPLVIDLRKGPQSVDFLYVIPTDDLTVKTEGKEKKITFKPGTFIEVKRYAQADLSGMELAATPPDGATVDSSGSIGGVMRKENVIETIAKKLGSAAASDAASGAPAKPAGNAPAPDGAKRNNSQDLLPDLPNHQIGL